MCKKDAQESSPSMASMYIYYFLIFVLDICADTIQLYKVETESAIGLTLASIVIQGFNILPCHPYVKSTPLTVYIVMTWK